MLGLLTLSFLGALSSVGLLCMRVALGVIFIAHGGQKLFGLFGGPGLSETIESFEAMGLSPGALWGTLAAAGEFFGGAMVLLGFFTRWGALALATVMAVAIAKVHWAEGFFLPAGIEYCLALLGMSLGLVFAGPGKISADKALFGSE